MEQQTRGSHPLMGDASCSLEQHLAWLCHQEEGKVCLTAQERIWKLEGNLRLYSEVSSFMMSAKKYWERGVNL